MWCRPKPLQRHLESAIETQRFLAILASALCRDDASRLALLLEIQRIVYHNLPFCFGEYNESRIIKEVCTKAELQAAINSHSVTHAIVELYASARGEIIGFLCDNRVGLIPFFVMVSDFWTCKTQGEKYLGIRVYLVDAQFRFKSVLLWVRHFRPPYGERDGGIRDPFKRWIKGTLDWGVMTQECFSASLSDTE